MRRPATALLALTCAAGLAVPLVGTPSPAQAASACPAGPALTFDEPSYVDTARAGGEPLVATHPSGRLYYSSHAGTTHFYSPEAAEAGSTAFIENYEGQTYFWTSDDNGKTWDFVPRNDVTSGIPGSGFSDPEIAIDSAGNTFFSEINLANIAISRSAAADRGSAWTLENPIGAVLTDRQWMEADRPDELYFVANAFGGGTGTPFNPGTGHFIAKSKDGGATFTTNEPDVEGGSGIGDIRVDKRTGTVYEAHIGGGVLSVAAFRNARADDLTATDTNPVADGVSLISSFAAIDLDPSGNVYITWDETGSGDRDAGIYYAYSKDGARTWSAPTKVDDGKGTAIWPWLAAGDDGRVAIAWLQADVLLPDSDGQTPGEHGWRVIGAATTSGLGCAGSVAPTFSRAVATQEPVHSGTICQSGTTCQATLTDRRLGDYISLDIDGTGRMYVGYSDTRVPAAVSLPGFVRQSGGPALLAPRAAPGKKPTATTGQPPVAVPPGALPGSGGTGGLAATGPGALLPLTGAGLLLVMAAARRRSRRA